MVSFSMTIKGFGLGETTNSTRKR